MVLGPILTSLLCIVFGFRFLVFIFGWFSLSENNELIGLSLGPLH